MKSVDEERLWQKLRLEWNYNSNHIEGNTLTYAETELLLIHGRTGGGRPMRDYEESTATRSGHYSGTFPIRNWSRRLPISTVRWMRSARR